MIVRNAKEKHSHVISSGSKPRDKDVTIIFSIILIIIVLGVAATFACVHLL